MAVMLSLGRESIAGPFLVLMNIIIPVVLLYLFYLCGVIGAGDIKLFSTISGFIGIRVTLRAIALSFLIGAVWSFIRIIRYRAGRKLLGNLKNKLLGRGIDHSLDEINKIPFTIAIGVGTVIALLL